MKTAEESNSECYCFRGKGQVRFDVMSMNTESGFNTKDMEQELTQLQLQMPVILEQLSHMFGTLMGKDSKVPSTSDIEREFPIHSSNVKKS